MLVPKMKLPEAAIAALPPMAVVAEITVLTDVMFKAAEPVKVSACNTLTDPPIMVRDPPNETVPLRDIVPLLLLAPIVKVLEALELKASWTYTENEVVLPTTESAPVASLSEITETLTSAVPVTVKVVPEILQLVPEVPVWPALEMIKIWEWPTKAIAILKKEPKKRTNIKSKFTCVKLRNLSSMQIK
jgi:hypothetical protein